MGSPSAPPAPTIPAAPPAPPTIMDPNVAAARANNQATANLQGRASTILSSPEGVTAPASTAKKTALGV